MAWDYAELSKVAKEFGGPEKFMEHIVVVSKKAGQTEMIPYVVGAFFGGGAIVFAFTKAINYFQKKKGATQAELEAAKAEIINGIKEYETSHPESMVSDCETTYQDEPCDK